jgi:hypothetical protein
METKTSKITRTIFRNEWTGPSGNKVFYHDVEFENGDKGQIGTKEKEPAKLNPGQELTYCLKKTDRGYKIEVQGPNGNGGGFHKRQAGSNASFAMAYSKDIIIASWSENSPKKLSSEDLFTLANKMFDWMEARK